MNADELAQILDELGRRLGPSGAYVFELAVRQVYISALVAGVVFLITLVVGVVGFRVLYGWYRAAEYANRSDRELALVIFGICYAIWAAIVIFWAIVAVPPVLNPEYAALRDLIGAIR